MQDDYKRWDRRFLRLALHISESSKDRSTKVGCVIVGPDGEIRSTGYNGFPRKVHDDLECRHERPEKYLFAEHGERNAIYNAARVGIPIKDCTLYFTSHPAKFPPCADCARAIIQSGIVRVVQESFDRESDGAKRWAESSKATFAMFKEAGIKFDEVDLNELA